MNTNNFENAVFVSYAWGGESECIVDELEQAFLARHIHIVRDKKEVAYKDSIEKFEQRIARGQCIVLVISNKYLRSKHCMYELMEVDNNQNIRKRIFPIVLADAQIYEPIGRLNHIKYWEEQIGELNQAIKQVGVLTALNGITADLEKYAHIRESFDHLVDLLGDMNALTPETHRGNKFSILIDAVVRAMSETTTDTEQIHLIPAGEFGEFTPERQQATVDALAGLLRIDPTNIRDLRVSEGSVAISLEMPSFAANRLYERAIAHDFRMMNLGIKSVMMDGRAAVELRVSPVEFVNREEELQQLDVESLRTHGESSPFTQVSAPVGYGKSYLLQKLIKEVQGKESLSSKWSICYIDLCEDINNQKQLIQDRITGILHRTLSVRQLCDHVINNLAEPYQNGRRAVLLVFDSLEKLDSDSEVYLIDFFIKLFQRTRPNPNREIITVRVILSGRRVDDFWEKYKKKDPGVLAPNKVLLSPFKDNPIEQLVGKRAHDMNLPLLAKDIKQYAYEVQYLSGGHPKIIRDLVDTLAKEAFAVEEGYFSDNRKELVETCVVPAANALLESISDDLKEYLCVLSVFRRLTISSINALVSENFLDETTLGIDLLGKLSEAHLLDAPELEDPFYRDHLMQRVLAIKMKYSSECQDSYMKYNKVALAMYERLILQPNISVASNDDFMRGVQLPYFYVEWLYHAIHDAQMTNDELRESFIKLGVPKSQISISMLKKRIRQDFEINYLAQSRFGEGAIDIICSWLD